MQRLPRTLLLFFLPVVPIGMGAAIMRTHGIPKALWSQNLAAAGVGTLLCAALAFRGAWLTRWNRTIIAIAIALLLASLGSEGLMGVHRWISLGPIRVHGAFLAVPLAITAICTLLRGRHAGWGLVGSFVLQALLLIQPDASQATALAAAFFVAAAGSSLRRVPRALAALGHILLAVAAWTRVNALAPVPHVEGIVDLAALDGSGWGMAALGALTLIPVPFLTVLLKDPEEVRRASPGLALAVYYSFLLLATLSGFFPIPLMGYGVSPILGYYLALGATQAYGRLKS